MDKRVSHESFQMHRIGFGQWRLSSRHGAKTIDGIRDAADRIWDRNHAVAKRQSMAGARSAPSRNQGESTMRAMFLALLMALGIGLVATSSSLAAPVYGGAIHNAARLNDGVDQVHWRWRHHWWWRHHHRHHHRGW
jgi:hypothetical protein